MSRPEAIIEFDGVCVLCNAWVRFLLKHDKQATFKFASMQSEVGRALLAKHGLNPDDPDSFLLLTAGEAYTDTSAILRVLGSLGGVWRLSRVALLLPRALRDRSYRWLAHKRYRLFGKHEACTVPDPSVQNRFL